MKNTKILCIDCHFFDNSKHKNDPRTSHAGLCVKWSEINFKNSTCKQAIPIQESEKNPFKEPLIDVTKLPSPTQLTFF